MTAASGRFAWPACGLLLLGLVPVVLHVYAAPEALPAGGLAAALPEALGRHTRPEPGPRAARWVASIFGARDYVSRRYAAGNGDRIELFVARTFDWKRLIHFPENALAHGHVMTGERRAEVDGLPVRVLVFETKASVRVAVSAVLLGDRAVSDPVVDALKEVPRLFVGRREPMTLVYAQLDGPPGSARDLETELRALVRAATSALLR